MIRLKVKEVAEQKGLSQAKLSRVADVDIKVIRRIYRYPTESVTTAVLDRVAKALGVDVTQLLESIPDDFQEFKE
ncbi:MAG TPA: helix-turn-helix transcriptional regulator [Ktedonobacteraceae bacterium]|nr:helix-turn-helix transcriptional regulator [Ktedonobacteraceae bacterium]